MNIQDLHRTTPEARAIARVSVEDFEVDFSLNSFQRNGGVADLMEAKGETTWGVLWEVPNFKSLDQREGSPLVYKRIPITVTLSSGETVEAQTYTVRHKEAAKQPSAEYLEILHKPFFELPGGYLESILKHAESLPQERKVSPDWKVVTELPRTPTTTRTFFSPWDAVAVFRHSFVLGGSSKLYHQPSNTLEWDSAEDLEKLIQH